MCDPNSLWAISRVATYGQLCRFPSCNLVPAAFACRSSVLLHFYYRAMHYTSKCGHQRSFKRYSLLFPKIGGSQPPPKASIAVISGTGKAIRTSNFVRKCTGLIGTEAHYKNFGKSSRGCTQGFSKIFGHPYGASRGHLCDSSAFLSL